MGCYHGASCGEAPILFSLKVAGFFYFFPFGDGRHSPFSFLLFSFLENPNSGLETAYSVETLHSRRGGQY